MIGSTSQTLPKEVSITIGDKELEYVIAKNKWNGAIFDREDTFKTLLKKGSEVEIPYIDIGKTAVINFKDYPPSQVTISDILIDKNGNQIYSFIAITKIPVVLKDGKCSIESNKNIASALSSTYVKNKIDIRGFRIIASWGDNECEYAFIIRTDGF